jgi:uncharacterized protein YcfJ
MKNTLLLLACVLAFADLSAHAQTASASKTPTAEAKAQYNADSKAALQRYESDKTLCNDETSSAARLQCRRDAKTEYDKAIAAAKAKMTTTAETAQARAACTDCGKVVSVSVTEKEGEGGPVGMIAGGVAGALLGQQIGGGVGKDIATVAGAVGGAYAGKEIEKKVRTHKVWTVRVQYPDGGQSSYDFKEDPGFAVGDTVKKSGDSVVRF